MRLFTKSRVVKSYAVSVSDPKLVEWGAEEFERLSTRLPVLTMEEEIAEIDEFVETDREEEQTRTSEQVEEALSHAETIISQAEIKVSEIIAEAKKEAEMIRYQAEQAAAQFRDDYVSALRDEVIPQARAEGYNAGLLEGQEKANKLLEEANSLFRLAEQALQDEYNKAHEDLLNLSIKIAERLIRASFAINPELLLKIMKDISYLPKEREGWRFRLSNQDIQWIENLSPEDRPSWTLVRDSTLSSGECILECQEGVFDARLESQLNILEQALREELAHGKLEKISSAGG